MPVHLQPFYQSIGFKSNTFPNAERYGNTAISLPIYPELKDETVKEISNILMSIVKQINS